MSPKSAKKRSPKKSPTKVNQRSPLKSREQATRSLKSRGPRLCRICPGQPRCGTIECQHSTIFKQRVWLSTTYWLAWVSHPFIQEKLQSKPTIPSNTGDQLPTPSNSHEPAPSTSDLHSNGSQGLHESQGTNNDFADSECLYDPVSEAARASVFGRQPLSDASTSVILFLCLFSDHSTDCKA